MLPENMYKIAQVAEAACKAHVCYISVTGEQHFACNLNSINRNIFKRRLTDNFFEIAAEIVPAQMTGAGKLLQGYF